jgi:hypothetical protein
VLGVCVVDALDERKGHGRKEGKKVTEGR